MPPEREGGGARRSPRWLVVFVAALALVFIASQACSLARLAGDEAVVKVEAQSSPRRASP